MDEFLKRFNDRLNGETLGVTEKAPKASTEGFLGKDGTWNSQIVHNGKKYRERVEILIFNKDTIFLAFKPDGTYKIPGGGTEPGSSMEVQVIHESREEAGIVPKNIAFVLSYGKDNKPGEFPDSPYDGAVTNLFVGEFGHQYTGSVHDADLDEFIKTNGRFYRIDEAYPKLTVFHKQAVDKWLSNSIATETVHYMNEMTSSERKSLSDDEFGIPSRRAFPLNDEAHVKAAINMFRHCPEKDRKALAERIFTKYREFNMDTQISKRNPLWKYAKKANGIVTEGVITVPVNYDRLDNYKQVPITEEVKLRYSLSYPELDRVRVDSRHSGYLWLDGSRVVGFVNTFGVLNGRTINDFYIEPEYKSSGLDVQMIAAAKTLGATHYSSKFDFAITLSDPSCLNGLDPILTNYNEGVSIDHLLASIDREMDLYLEAPDGPTDYTASQDEAAEVQGPADGDPDDDDMDDDPTDYTDDVDDGSADDDDIDGSPTDYTANQEEDNGGDDAGEAEPQDAGDDNAEPANDEGENNTSNNEENAPDNADDNADGGDENNQADDAGDSDGSDDGSDDGDVQGEPTDYTDNADGGDGSDGGDDGGDGGSDDQGNDQGGDDSGGGEATTDEQIDDTRKSRNLYKKMLGLYDFNQSCINKLDSLPNTTTNSSVIIQGVKKKFVEINELMNDYMITKFMNDTLIEQEMNYQKFLVSVAKSIELMENNNVYLKQ